MSLRQRMRFLQRAARAVAVGDTAWPHPAPGGLLFSCNDVDRSMADAAGLRFSPLLEGIRHLTQSAGLPVCNLTHPWAVFRGEQVQGGSLTVNRRIVGLRLRAVLTGRPRIELETAMYARLLQQLRPRFVFSIQPPAGLCIAARRAGFPVAEAMHGTNVSLSDKNSRMRCPAPTSGSRR